MVPQFIGAKPIYITRITITTTVITPSHWNSGSLCRHIAEQINNPFDKAVLVLK